MGGMWVRHLVGGLAAVAALAGATAVAVPAVRHSDAATTVSVVAAAAPPALPAGPLPAAVRARWSAPSRVASSRATSVETGTVVVADGSGVAGRDPVTGAQRWAYHRGNARLCGWTARDGVVVAAFGKSDGCTDLTALDAGTGARRWYRNADLGPEADLTGAAGVVVARSGDQLLAVDTATGLNRWTARKPGCRYGPVVVGSLGAAAVLHCGDRVELVSHDPYADRQRFSVRAPGADPVVLAVSDQEVAVLAGARDRRTLTVYGGSGRRLGAVTDRRVAGPVPSDWPAGVAAGGLLLFWTGRSVLAIDPVVDTVRWVAPAGGPPTLDGDRILFAVPGAFVECAPRTGRQLAKVAADTAGPGPGAALGRIGRLVVATAGERVTVFG